MRVLIADDNRDAADTLGMVVRIWGYDVQVVYDGASALTVAHCFKPHFILLDIQMPKVNGGDVALNLRRQPGLKGTKIIAVSASDPNDDRLARYKGVFDAYLNKPCDLERLEELMTGRSANSGCRCRSTAATH